MPEKSGSNDRRRHIRYEVDWNVSIMNKSGAPSEIYRDRIHDISLCGAGIYSDADIFTAEQLVILLETPFSSGKMKKVITGIECNMCRPVFLTECGRFHVGLDFVYFHGIGKHFLAEALFVQMAGAQKLNQEADSLLE